MLFMLRYISKQEYKIGKYMDIETIGKLLIDLVRVTIFDKLNDKVFSKTINAPFF